MKKRLRADIFFNPPRDFYCLDRQLTKTTPPNWHCHEYYEVEIITAGTAVDEINDQRYILNRGDFMILQPDDFHSIQCCDDTGSHLINIAVSIPLMEEILTFSGIDDISLLPWPIKGQLPHEMISLLTTHTKELLSLPKQVTRERGIIKQWISTCLLCSNVVHKSDYEKNTPAWLKQLILKMKTPEGIAGGIEYLKTCTDYSYPHVCRSFQKYLMQSPVEWINEQRLIYSSHLLLHTNQSILEISLECGFHNLSHFNHLFKAFYGVSPKTLRSLL